MTRVARAVLLVGLALFVAPLGAPAPPATRILRIGELWPGAPPSGSSAGFEGFRQGLRDLGYIEGQIPQSVLLRADEVIQ